MSRALARPSRPESWREGIIAVTGAIIPSIEAVLGRGLLCVWN
ncbi:MAG TPA: hypothetical protein VKE72_05000 [Methylocella sp.]|nr:hypothetical protein [Methylocella sp.]